jgi:hypothetical protein
MIACDNFMNVTLRDVILTAPEGDKFYQMKEVYLKGNVVSVSVLWLRLCNARMGRDAGSVRSGCVRGWFHVRDGSDGKSTVSRQLRDCDARSEPTLVVLEDVKTASRTFLNARGYWWKGPGTRSSHARPAGRSMWGDGGMR